MICRIRNSVCARVLWGVLLLHLINISVNVSNINQPFIPEDLTINNQESIIEIVVEQVLGYEDAFKEYDDNDSEDHTKKTNIKPDIIAYSTIPTDISRKFFNGLNQKFPGYNNGFLRNGFLKLDNPPPEA